MKIELNRIKIREVIAGYKDSAEEGVIAYNGKLDIRPKYQREFVYTGKQRDAVIATIKNGFPLNVMYWMKNEAGDFEVLDGQQRTISIGQYVNGDFSVDFNGRLAMFHNLTKEEQNKILDYELWNYFQSVITWTRKVFPNYLHEMSNVSWGELYNEFKNEKFDLKKLEKEVLRLMQDEDVTKKSGIYEYVLTRNEKYLNIRAFNDKMKREAYERQKGVCRHCKKHFEIDEMEADHIKPWSKGGKTDSKNCQMLCMDCNRTKSGK
jgi:hypothetical protein